MKTSKKTLAILMALAMILALMVPAMASGGTTTYNNATTVQITKTLKIGRGITVPTEDFTFKFTPLNETEANTLGVTDNYNRPGSTQVGGAGGLQYPALSDATVAYNSSSRTPDGTDTELTFVSDPIDLSTLNNSWPTTGIFIYKVTETAPNLVTAGMTYSDAVYLMKVYVKNATTGSGYVADTVQVYGKNTAGEWEKIEAAPNPNHEASSSSSNDGSADYVGNDFKFVNTYVKTVDKHPTVADNTSPGLQENAFVLSKAVSGEYASSIFGFDFKVRVILPETANNTPSTVTIKVNGYTVNYNNNNSATYNDSEVVESPMAVDQDYNVFLRHGETFEITELPAGTIVQVQEMATNEGKYLPSYTGIWGGNLDAEHYANGEKGQGLLVNEDVVVGERGALVQFTNTLDSNDVTATGIVINNLPYILMIVIAVAGIGFYMVSKKRRA